MSRVLVLCSDITEASQIKWIRAIRSAGHDVTSLSFRRNNMNLGFTPDWTDIPLGEIGNGVTPHRLASLMRAALVALGQRDLFRSADVILARDLDMALLATLVAGPRIPLIYQSLDIHRILTSRSAAGRVARLAERLVLTRASSVITSAPEFLSRHFRLAQGYWGPVHLVENRIFWPEMRPPRDLQPQPTQADRIRLGWTGTLRCPATWQLLQSVAQRAEGRIEIILRGVVHTHQLPGFEAQLARCPNIRYEGPYQYPEGLAWAYKGLDCVWAQDLWQRGGNSDWLLPNRLYEAGYFGCPVMAVAGTATAKRVTQDGTGLVIPDASTNSVLAALEHARPTLSHLRRRILGMPDEKFCLSRRDIDTALDVEARLPSGALAHAG